jgi:enoyl-CoA hydratase
MPVRVECQGPVTTVVLSRPGVRNAVDGPTAAELAAAFRAFEADEEARVAVLWGEGDTSARAPASRRSAPGAATGPSRTATDPWGRPGGGCRSR